VPGEITLSGSTDEVRRHPTLTALYVGDAGEQDRPTNRTAREER
jgi:hypothetical protein